MFLSLECLLKQFSVPSSYSMLLHVFTGCSVCHTVWQCCVSISVCLDDKACLSDGRMQTTYTLTPVSAHVAGMSRLSPDWTCFTTVFKPVLRLASTYSSRVTFLGRTEWINSLTVWALHTLPCVRQDVYSLILYIIVYYRQLLVIFKTPLHFGFLQISL